MARSNAPLLRIDDLTKTYDAHRRSSTAGRLQLPAVDRVSFTVERGESVGLIGESGSGKSTLARMILRLIEPSSGRIVFDGEDVTTVTGKALQAYRRNVQLIFQDPYSSLDPRYTVRRTIEEPLRRYRPMRPGKGIGDRIVDVLNQVGLPLEMLERTPSGLSGGQRQRVGIARALAISPSLIVADEPVSALDVSIQAQVLNLFADIKREMNLTYLFIAHGLGAVRQISDRVMVMYRGRILEVGSTDVIFERCLHPYTEALLAAARSSDVNHPTPPPARRYPEVEGPRMEIYGCRFSDRCAYREEICTTDDPKLQEIKEGHMVACHFPLSSVSGSPA